MADNAPQHVLGTVVEKVWEGQRWWVGAGWCDETHRFVPTPLKNSVISPPFFSCVLESDHQGPGSDQVPDGQQDGGPWKATKDALAPSLEGLKDKAAALKAKVSGNEAEVVTALADGLLESANASLRLPDSDYAELVRAAGSGACWMWANEAWRVVRDGGTDRDGWSYASDWDRLAAPRDGGRKSQRTRDVVRRRCLVRPRVLVATGDGPTPTEVSERLGDGTVSIMDAIAELEQTRKDEREAEKQHVQQVMDVVLGLTKTHVLGRKFSDQPLDPTAWYRLSNTHAVRTCQTMEKRPAVTDGDVLLLRDLVRAMRFANGAYGFAAENMATIKSNIKLHTARAAGGVDYKNGVEDSVNIASLCKHAEVPTEAIIYSRWDAGPHSPACFFAVAAPRTDESSQQLAGIYEGEPGWLVLGIRGTLNSMDALCDVDAAEVDFLGGKAHQGFVRAADAVRQQPWRVVDFRSSASAACHHCFAHVCHHVRAQLCAELQETLVQACDDPRYAGYELIVTGHSLGGCTAEVVALKLRELGRQKSLDMLTKTRCLAFAGGPAATPDLQQSVESQELTVCVVYGDDIVPRLGAASVCTLLDELSEHGVAAIARRKLGGGAVSPPTEGVPPEAHKFRNFAGWVGLPDGGDCRVCGVKRWKPGDSKYCEKCLVCENCCTKTKRVTSCESESEPEPEPPVEDVYTRPTQLALGGRVIWIDPDFSHESGSSATVRSFH